MYMWPTTEICHFMWLQWNLTILGCSHFLLVFVLFLQNMKYTLTHWGRVMHICIGNLTIIGSDNDFIAWLAPSQYLNGGSRILLIVHLGTNFSEILIRNQTFSYKKMRSKVSSAKWWPFCLGLNVLMSKIYENQMSAASIQCLFQV